MTREKIGEMNGGWAMMLKVALASYPLVLAWAGWASYEIVAMTANRWTSKNQAEYAAEHARDHAKLPPNHVTAAIESASHRISRLEGFHLK